METTVKGFPKLGVPSGIPMIGSIIFFGSMLGSLGLGELSHC